MIGLLMFGMVLVSLAGVSAVDVSGCQVLNSAGTTYNIINNIVPNVSSCFIISADNITVIGNDYTIINETYSSVLFLGSGARNNITIKNIGEIKLGQTATAYSFDFALNSNNINIINNTMNNTYLGIRDRGIDNLLFKDNTVYGAWGLGLYYTSTIADNVTIYNNTFDGITGSSIWYFAGDSNNLNVTDNTIINMADTSYNFVYNNGKSAESAIIQGNNITTNSNNNPSGASYFWYQFGGTFNNSNFKGNNMNNAGINALYISGNSASTNHVKFEDNIFKDIYITNLIGPSGGDNLSVVNNTFNNVSTGANIIVFTDIINANVSNNLFKNIKDDNSLIYISYIGGTRNSTIAFNEFINNTPASFGGVANINLNEANTTDIFNNTWTNSTAYYSIQINGPSYSINVYNNNMSCRDEVGSHGVVFREVYNSPIYDNKVYDCDFGVLFHNGSRNNNAYRNHVQSGNVGLYVLDNAFNNTAYNFTMEGVTTGISFYRYIDRGNLQPANNTIYNFVLNNTGTDIKGYNCSSERGTNIIRDTISTGSTTFIDISLDSTSLILINVTSDSSTETVADTSSFPRKWYLDSSSNINNTNITITNSTGDIIYSNLTNSSIPQQTLLSYENIGGTTTWYSNYTITASADNYFSQSIDINLTDNNNTSFILLESVAPMITLISPADSYSTTASSTTINFQFNISDDSAISNCSVYYTGGSSGNTSLMNNSGGTNTISASLSSGSYSWYVNCTDSVNNIGNSSTRSLTINVPASSGSDSGGGGIPKYRPSESELTQGYSRNLGVNWAILFKLMNETYSLKISDIDGNETYLKLNSIEGEKILSIGQEWKIDLDNDNEDYDLIVRLSNIVNGRANISLKTISQVIVSSLEQLEFECEGCLLNETCFPFYHRLNETYCDVENDWLNYTQEDESCFDDYQCKTNLCVGDVCRDRNLIWRFLNWLMDVVYGFS